MKFNLKELLKCIKKHFNIEKMLSNLTDNRKWYKIPISSIFFSIFLFLPLLRKPSFLSLDHLLKKDYTKNFLKCKRKMITSDSTLIRNLSSNFKEDEIIKINKNVILKNSEYLKDPVLGKIIGILDGSGFGHFMKEIMIISGKINQIIDWQPIEKKGKELVGAKEVLKSVSKNYPELKIDIILADALYYSKECFSDCRKLFNTPLMVKFRDPSINVIKDALIYFEEKKSSDVIRDSGFDDKNMISYEIETVKNLKADTIDELLSVSRIKEKNSKNNKEEVFYIVTNDLNLSNEKIRYLAHKRWQIENNTFKEMNKIFSSKRKYTKDEMVDKILFHILFIYFNVLQYYLFVNDGKNVLGVGKTIILDILQLFYESLILYSYNHYG